MVFLLSTLKQLKELDIEILILINNMKDLLRLVLFEVHIILLGRIFQVENHKQNIFLLMVVDGQVMGKLYQVLLILNTIHMDKLVIVILMNQWLLGLKVLVMLIMQKLNGIQQFIVLQIGGLNVLVIHLLSEKPILFG